MDNLLLPLFPLEIVLLPEEPLPLHIFEDRYKEMIGECLKAKEENSGQQEFGIVLAHENEMRTVGCSAKIVNVTRKYPDGRMDLFTVGLRRFEVLYTDEERSFLRGGVDFFDDDAGAELPGDADAARAIELFSGIIRRLRKTEEVPIHFPRPYRHLSFRIASALPLELDFKFHLLSMRNESNRLRETIQTLEGLLPQIDRVERTRAKAGGNGHSS